MKTKGVFEIVPTEEMPSSKRALETMWRFQIKTDEHDNVLRFRPRLRARGANNSRKSTFILWISTHLWPEWLRLGYLWLCVTC